MPRPVGPRGRPGFPVLPRQVLNMHRRVSSSDEAMPYRVTLADPDRQVTDPDTGLAVTTPGQVRYSDLRARLHPVPLNEEQVDLVGQAEQKSRWYLRVPVGTVVRQNQRVKVTACDERYGDVTLVDRVFRVLDGTPRTFGTELRVTVSEQPVPRAA